MNIKCIEDSRCANVQKISFNYCSHAILTTLQESSTDGHEEDNRSERMGTSYSGSRKSSTSPPSPEAYESSPISDRKYHASKYIVTSI